MTAPAPSPYVFHPKGLFGHRVKTPTVLQIEETECGAACLAIILWHYGCYIPLEELRVATGVSRDGSKASNMVEAAQHYGLIAKGYRYEPEDLPSLHLPIIVFWNFVHYVVVDGFGRDKVYLNDPATGPRTVSSADFNKAFTGVVLTFEPGPDFKREGQKPSVVRGLRERFRHAGLPLAFILLASVALMVLQLITPTFANVFIQRFLIENQTQHIDVLLAAVAATALLFGAFTWVQQMYLLRMQTKLSLGMSSRFLWHVVRLPLSFFSQRYAGEIGTRVALNDTLAQLLSGTLATNILGVLLIGILAVFMFKYDVVLSLLAIAIGALNLVALRLVSRRRKDQNQRLLQEQAVLLGIAMNGLRSIETIKAGGSESDFFEQWAGHQTRVINAEQDFGLSTQSLAAVPVLLAGINTTAILVVGGWRVISGNLTIGELVAFQLLVGFFLAPIAGLVTFGSSLQEAVADVHRLDDVLRNPMEVQSNGASESREPAPSNGSHSEGNGSVPNGKPTLMSSRLIGRVELKGVSFGYNPLEPPLIDDFSLAIEPGHRVALVGASGSGKSTVVKLVSGLLQPWKGEILFDGMARLEVPPQIRTDSMAVASQEIVLFEGTIKQNLTLWDTTIPFTAIVQAAKDAQIHDVIAAQPSGYDYVLREDGSNFSGGQRQRLAIARALAGNPSVLILDEATSSLDTVAEQMVDDAIRERGCTCLIVAHRLSTIRDADEIIVLENGKVVQRGTHAAMIDTDGPYARLIKAGPDSVLESATA